MISTKLHGSIDYAVSLLFAGFAASRALAGPARAVFGAAGAYHSAYSLMTDYEAGAVPLIGMRRHLALDAAGAAALLGAAMLLPRQPSRARALLLAAGLAECAVILCSTADPELDAVPHGAGAAAEPALDTPRQIAPGLFVVESVLQRPFGIQLPVRMTVIRLPNGDLLLHSPTRFTPELRNALQRLGRIRYLVAPNTTHWMFLGPWQQACPDATTWAAPGLRKRWQVRRSGIRIDRTLDEPAPPEWSGVRRIIVPGGLGFREVALFHDATGTLVLTDLVLNLSRDQLPAAVRPLAAALDVVDSRGKPPVYVRAVISLRRQAAREAAHRLLALQPERVIFAHGAWFERNATESLRQALRWLLS